MPPHNPRAEAPQDVYNLNDSIHSITNLEQSMFPCWVVLGERWRNMPCGWTGVGGYVWIMECGSIPCIHTSLWLGQAAKRSWSQWLYIYVCSHVSTDPYNKVVKHIIRIPIVQCQIGSTKTSSFLPMHPKLVTFLPKLLHDSSPSPCLTGTGSMYVPISTVALALLDSTLSHFPQ